MTNSVVIFALLSHSHMGELGKKGKELHKLNLRVSESYNKTAFSIEN
jgi:hypothetical protein